jgi:hypothetical protein
MKLKLDENGNVVVIDGKPVYVYDDGKEVPFDAAKSLSKIKELQGEAKSHRLKAEEAVEKLKSFEGIEDPAKAIEALSVVKNLDDKKLVDAGEVEALKAQIVESAKEERERLVKQFEQEREELVGKLSSKESTIFDLTVRSKFYESPFFSGDKPKTLLPPDMAADYFSKYFKVEGDEGRPVVVGYYNGEKILSRENIGEPADFHEAISMIIEKYPQKDRIMRETAGGSGAHGNAGSGGNGSSISRSEFTQKSPADRAAFIREGGTVSD